MQQYSVGLLVQDLVQLLCNLICPCAPAAQGMQFEKKPYIKITVLSYTGAREMTADWHGNSSIARIFIVSGQSGMVGLKRTEHNKCFSVEYVIAEERRSILDGRHKGKQLVCQVQIADAGEGRLEKQGSAPGAGHRSK